MNFFQYIKQIKNYNRKFFYLIMVVCFIFIENFIIQILDINYIQLTPFTGFGMYSEKIETKNSYTVYEVTINGNERIRLWDYPQQNKQVLQHVLTYYQTLIENSDLDPRRQFLTSKFPSLHNQLELYINSKTDYSKFKNWYKRYLEQTIGKKVKSYTIFKLRLNYTKGQNLTIQDSTLFIQYK